MLPIKLNKVAVEDFVNQRELANTIRILSAEAVQLAGSGHPGLPMGMADVATVLFQKHLKFVASAPEWPDRDRFVLSAGHGSMLLYSLLYLTGYPGVTLEVLQKFRRLGKAAAGHPEYWAMPGIEATTGALGQGFAMGVGMALAERNLAAKFGDELVDHYTYVMCGDGCLMEGISQEAASFAGHLGLGKLIVLFDDNQITIDGPLSMSSSENIPQRFAACNWHVQAIDGHDTQQIDEALIAAKKNHSQPSLIACRTIIGYGSPNKAGTAVVHGTPLGTDELELTRRQLGWGAGAGLSVPSALLQQWRSLGQQHLPKLQRWQLNWQNSPNKNELEHRYNGNLGTEWHKALAECQAQFNTETSPIRSEQGSVKKVATRQLSQQVIKHLVEALPELVGGSADLSPSNGTWVAGMKDITAQNYGGNYVRYGCREHAMGAIMNGMSLHRGVIPYGGTFLVFSDYLRPALRFSALMGQPVIYVFTHDSIGVGEDGPTHQPIEHLSSLRAIPNLNVLRPANAREVVESWALALATKDRPTALILSRQGVPMLDNPLELIHHGSKIEADYKNKPFYITMLGGYVLNPFSGENNRDIYPHITLVASGSEVAIALEAQKTLEGNYNLKVNVVSMPCLNLFLQQPQDYQNHVLGGGQSAIIAIEAASSWGWEKIARQQPFSFVGIDQFGASGPAEELYSHFGITPEAVVQTALRNIRNHEQ